MHDVVGSGRRSSEYSTVIEREYVRNVPYANCNLTSARHSFSREQLLSPAVDRFCRTSILSLCMRLPGMLPVHLRS